MTITLIRGGERYARRHERAAIAGAKPHRAEVEAQQERVFAELERGGRSACTATTGSISSARSPGEKALGDAAGIAQLIETATSCRSGSS
jgi:hypothetical protein